MNPECPRCETLTKSCQRMKQFIIDGESHFKMYASKCREIETMKRDTRIREWELMGKVSELQKSNVALRDQLKTYLTGDEIDDIVQSCQQEVKEENVTSDVSPGAKNWRQEYMKVYKQYQKLQKEHRNEETTAAAKRKTKYETEVNKLETKISKLQARLNDQQEKSKAERAKLLTDLRSERTKTRDLNKKMTELAVTQSQLPEGYFNLATVQGKRGRSRFAKSKQIPKKDEAETTSLNKSQGDQSSDTENEEESRRKMRTLESDSNEEEEENTKAELTMTLRARRTPTSASVKVEPQPKLRRSTRRTRSNTAVSEPTETTPKSSRKAKLRAKEKIVSQTNDSLIEEPVDEEGESGEVMECPRFQTLLQLTLEALGASGSLLSPLSSDGEDREIARARKSRKIHKTEIQDNEDNIDFSRTRTAPSVFVPKRRQRKVTPPPMVRNLRRTRSRLSRTSLSADDPQIASYEPTAAVTDLAVVELPVDGDNNNTTSAVVDDCQVPKSSVDMDAAEVNTKKRGKRKDQELSVEEDKCEKNQATENSSVEEGGTDSAVDALDEVFGAGFSATMRQSGVFVMKDEIEEDDDEEEDLLFLSPTSLGQVTSNVSIEGNDHLSDISFAMKKEPDVWPVSSTTDEIASPSATEDSKDFQLLMSGTLNTTAAPPSVVENSLPTSSVISSLSKANVEISQKPVTDDGKPQPLIASGDDFLRTTNNLESFVKVTRDQSQRVNGNQNLLQPRPADESSNQNPLPTRQPDESSPSAMSSNLTSLRKRQIDVSPSPETCTNVSPSPEAAADVSPTPEPCVNVSPSPEAAVDVSPSPETCVNLSPSPEAAADVSPSPEAFANLSPSPEAAADVSPSPKACANVSPSPEAAADVSPSPKACANVSPSPEAAADVSPSPKACANVSPSPEAAADVSPSPKACANVSPSPEAAADVSPSPKACANVSPSPEAAADVSPSPQPCANVSPSPEACADVSPSPEACANVSPSPEACADVSPSPEACTSNSSRKLDVNEFQIHHQNERLASASSIDEVLSHSPQIGLPTLLLTKDNDSSSLKIRRCALLSQDDECRSSTKNVSLPSRVLKMPKDHKKTIEKDEKSEAAVVNFSSNSIPSDKKSNKSSALRDDTLKLLSDFDKNSILSYNNEGRKNTSSGPQTKTVVSSATRHSQSNMSLNSTSSPSMESCPSAVSNGSTMRKRAVSFAGAEYVDKKRRRTLQRQKSISGQLLAKLRGEAYEEEFYCFMGDVKFPMLSPLRDDSDEEMEDDDVEDPQLVTSLPTSIIRRLSNEAKSVAEEKRLSSLRGTSLQNVSVDSLKAKLQRQMKRKKVSMKALTGRNSSDTKLTSPTSNSTVIPNESPTATVNQEKSIFSNISSASSTTSTTSNSSSCSIPFTPSSTLDMKPNSILAHGTSPKTSTSYVKSSRTTTKLASSSALIDTNVDCSAVNHASVNFRLQPESSAPVSSSSLKLTSDTSIDVNKCSRVSSFANDRPRVTSSKSSVPVKRPVRSSIDDVRSVISSLISQPEERATAVSLRQFINASNSNIDRLLNELCLKLIRDPSFSPQSVSVLMNSLTDSGKCARALEVARNRLGVTLTSSDKSVEQRIVLLRLLLALVRESTGTGVKGMTEAVVIIADVVTYTPARDTPQCFCAALSVFPELARNPFQQSRQEPGSSLYLAVNLASWQLLSRRHKTPHPGALHNILSKNCGWPEDDETIAAQLGGLWSSHKTRYLFHLVISRNGEEDKREEAILAFRLITNLLGWTWSFGCVFQPLVSPMFLALGHLSTPARCGLIKLLSVIGCVCDQSHNRQIVDVMTRISKWFNLSEKVLKEKNIVPKDLQTAIDCLLILGPFEPNIVGVAIVQWKHQHAWAHKSDDSLSRAVRIQDFGSVYGDEIQYAKNAFLK